MKTIAKVIESMLSQDATRQWQGLPETAGPCGGWGWGGASPDLSSTLHV